MTDAPNAIGFWLTVLKGVAVLLVLALFFVQFVRGRISMKVLRERWWEYWW